MRLPDVPGIVDPENFGWPRKVESSEGVITLDALPQVAHFASLGHAEIAFGLIDPSRIAAGYSFFTDPEVSNIADVASDLVIIGFEPEEVVALEPDIVVASKFSDPDLVAVFKGAGIPVLRTALEGTDGDVPNILLLAYVLGAEDRGIELAGAVKARLDFVVERLDSVGKDTDLLPSVLGISKYTDIWAGGKGSNIDSIINAAGGRNAAAGLDDFQQISIESIAAMDPDVIIVTQPEESGNALIEELKQTAVLASVPAIANNRVAVVNTTHFTTLSHWNVRGIETLAQMLYPELFEGIEFVDFEPYAP